MSTTTDKEETMAQANALQPHVGLAVLSSPLEIGADQAPELAHRLQAALEADGYSVTNGGSIDTPDAAARRGRAFAAAGVGAIVLGAASWFEDYLALDLLEECAAPLLLWPRPGMETGALCGTQQLTCYLKQLGTRYSSVFGTVEDADCREHVRIHVHAATLHRRLRRARIGLAGQRVRGMTEVAVNEMALKKAVGPRLVPVDMPTLLRHAEEVDPAATQPVWDTIRRAAGHVRVADADGRQAAGVYLSIRDEVRRQGLAGLAFGCYPDYMGCACLAASLLADEGIPVGCEGDGNTTVGQVMLTWLTGEPTHNTDWLDPLPDGSVVFTHCGSGSYTLAEKRDDITLAPVRLAGQGVCSLFPARPGPVTLLSLLPVGNSYQVAMLQGDALPTEMVFPGNPLRVRFNHPAAAVARWIFESGIGHHWAAGYGSVAAEIRAWARIAGADVRLLEMS